ncbi:DUF1552 domain-containing protein [Haloferula chungangensis]|uniref:DUF1552 domain-containing protein n=1 Tax=Haloferula chungangensis TaxID=1048331 RepID=A0ABW2L0K4_9BACT
MRQDFSNLSRRSFLRGLGVSMALPGLEAFRPLLAAEASARALGTTASGAPLRMAYLYVPNGVNVKKWRPSGSGENAKLGETFAPVEHLRDDFQVFSGFEHKNATTGGDGAGDHARGSATFLTGQRAKKTAGSDIHLGVSVDQVAAMAAKDLTRFPSLELTTAGVRKSGVCDSGYSCAYVYNISWRSENQPMTPESNPRAVFERLFGGGGANERIASLGQRYASKRSLLDFIQEDAKALHKHLGRNDRQKVDEYLTGVREIELQIEKVEALGLPPDPGVDAPEGKGATFSEHVRLLMDMMVLAFKTDSTRIATFLLEHEGSNRSFRELGVSEGHHSISHHQGKKDNLEKIAKIDRFYMEQMAYFMEKMKAVEDVDGKSLLHNSMVVYGSCLADGNRHNNDNIPIVVAGNGGGVFNPGRHVDLGEDTPMSNLYVRMLNEFGVQKKDFGDSNGVLRKI